MSNWEILDVRYSLRLVTRHFIGTHLSMPPEMIERKRQSFEADIWSLGVIFTVSLPGSADPADRPTLEEISCHAFFTGRSSSVKRQRFEIVSMMGVGENLDTTWRTMG
eukprot:scaffold689243_cov79-Attheya_sp.AAC.2